MSNSLKTTSEVVNLLDWVTNIATTALLYNNTAKAKKVIMVASLSMSALAIGVSVWQTERIKNDIKDVESNLRDQILRKG